MCYKMVKLSKFYKLSQLYCQVKERKKWIVNEVRSKNLMMTSSIPEIINIFMKQQNSFTYLKYVK